MKIFLKALVKNLHMLYILCAVVVGESKYSQKLLVCSYVLWVDLIWIHSTCVSLALCKDLNLQGFLDQSDSVSLHPQDNTDPASYKSTYTDRLKEHSSHHLGVFADLADY